VCLEAQALELELERRPLLLERGSSRHSAGRRRLARGGRSGYCYPAVLAELEPLATSTAAYGIVIALGLLWGSFANVCIYRCPAGRSVVTPGSRCMACQAPIRWYDNVPVLAWLWLRGRCRACKAAFSPRYLIVEAATGALFGFAWWVTVIAPAPFEPFCARLLHFAIDAAFCFAMVVIAFIDIDHKLILHKVTIPSIALAYLASFASPRQRWYDGVIGAVVGYGLPWAIGELYYLIRRREAMGLGDGMLLAVVGALLGWRGVLVALFGGSMIGSVIGSTAVISARMRGDEPPVEQAPADEPPAENPPQPASDPGASAQEDAPSLMRTELPFGPFLAIAAVLYLFAEPWFHLDFHPPGG
jgi:leader peptidase (prepilin peptidase)/N-methyltransferase